MRVYGIAVQNRNGAWNWMERGDDSGVCGVILFETEHEAEQARDLFQAGCSPCVLHVVVRPVAIPQPAICDEVRPSPETVALCGGFIQTLAAMNMDGMENKGEFDALHWIISTARQLDIKLSKAVNGDSALDISDTPEVVSRDWENTKASGSDS